jgi:carboxylesterase type B
MSDLIVETRYGKVQGYEQGLISVWKGIPFAQPPTGERRCLSAAAILPLPACRLGRHTTWKGAPP